MRTRSGLMMLLLAGLCSVPAVSLADGPAVPAASPAAAAAAEKLALAKKYYDVARVEKMAGDKQQLEDALSQQLQSLEQGFAQQAGKSEADRLHKVLLKTRPKLSKIIASNLDAMRPQMVNVIAQTYSSADLQALIDFYETPAGKSVADKGAVLVKGMMTVSAKYNAEMMQSIHETLGKEMQAGMAK